MCGVCSTPNAELLELVAESHALYIKDNWERVFRAVSGQRSGPVCRDSAPGRYPIVPRSLALFRSLVRGPATSGSTMLSSLRSQKGSLEEVSREAWSSPWMRLHLPAGRLEECPRPRMLYVPSS